MDLRYSPPVLCDFYKMAMYDIKNNTESYQGNELNLYVAFELNQFIKEEIQRNPNEFLPWIMIVAEPKDAKTTSQYESLFTGIGLHTTYVKLIAHFYEAILEKMIKDINPDD